MKQVLYATVHFCVQFILLNWKIRDVNKEGFYTVCMWKYFACLEQLMPLHDSYELLESSCFYINAFIF